VNPSQTDYGKATASVPDGPTERCDPADSYFLVAPGDRPAQ
jgi:hypothetical protein